MALVLTSSAFPAGGEIPQVHTCDGADLSPALAWRGAPPETASFALICRDPDAPAGTWYHWAIFDMPATLTALPEGVEAPALPAGVKLGTNDFQRLGYGGPCPPRGHGPHRYHFTIFALDALRLGVPAAAKASAVEAAAQRHALARAELTGLYGR